MKKKYGILNSFFFIDKYYQIGLLLLIFFICSLPSFAVSRFSGERLKEECIQFVIDQAGTDAQVSISQGVEDQNFDEDGITATCQATPGSLHGNTHVAIEFRHGNQLIKRLEVAVRVKIFKDVPVTTTTIRRNQDITKQDIAIETRDITNYKESELVPVDQIVGNKAKSNISKGSIITISSIFMDFTVKRGDKVTIVVQYGAVRIRTTGEALQDAGCGDNIRVKREGTGIILTGKVAMDGSVNIAC
jgi:flagella basal body P-ring formation protein FlgA